MEIAVAAPVSGVVETLHCAAGLWFRRTTAGDHTDMNEPIGFLK